MSKKHFGVAILVLLGAILYIAAGTSGNRWYIGDGNPSTTKEILFNNGTPNPPGIRYNTVSSSVEVSDGGGTWEPPATVGGILFEDITGGPAKIGGGASTNTSPVDIIGEEEVGTFSRLSQNLNSAPDTRGQSFTPTVTNTLRSISFYVRNSSLTAGSIAVEVWSITGTPPNIAADTLLSTSSPIPYTDFIAGDTLTFDFSSDPTVLNAGTKYIARIVLTGTSGVFQVVVTSTDWYSGGGWLTATSHPNYAESTTQDIVGFSATGLVSKTSNVEMKGSTSGTVELDAPDVVDSYNLKFPDSPPTDGDVLVSNAGGEMSWEKLGSRETTFSLAGSGAFTGGTCRVYRIGYLANITCKDVNHNSSASPASGALLPEWARPSSSVYSTQYAISTILTFYLNGNSLLLIYRNWTGGAQASTSPNTNLSITYDVRG